MSFSGNGALLLVAGLGGVMIYKKYAEDRSIHDGVTKLENPLHNRNVQNNHALLGGGGRNLPTQAHFRPNPLLSQPAFSYSNSVVAPKFRHRLMNERRMMQMDHPTGYNDMRENNHFVAYAGDNGLSNSRFYAQAARAQSSMGLRKWRPGL